MGELKVAMNASVAGSNTDTCNKVRNKSMANIMIDQIMEDMTKARPPDRKELFC